MMTLQQAKATLAFHKKAYRAYMACGQINNAKQARAKMLSLYLYIRSIR